MEKRVLTCIVTGYGINADYELQEAFRASGSTAERIHVTDIIEQPNRLKKYHIVAFPGGFSFGDHLGSGKVLANLFKQNLKEHLNTFVREGKLIIGICNGFQVLVKMGILPNIGGSWEQETSLIHNISGKFEDRWVQVVFNPDSPSIWTKGINQMELPVRHGEGQFVAKTDNILENLRIRNLIALKYTHRRTTNAKYQKEPTEIPYPDNPNGSVDNIAGICDTTGRILGLMPHPEAFLIPENHPLWTRKTHKQKDGLNIFKNGVKYVKENLI